MSEQRGQLPVSPSKSVSFLSVFFLITVYYFLFFCQQTVLTASDLGRHLMNGQVIWQTGHVITTNFYSYTQPDRFVPNHHWLFGVAMYGLERLWGFAGLTVISALLYTSSTSLGLWYVGRRYGTKVMAVVGLCALPLITFRNEVRPEAFSLFFFSLQLFLLLLWREGRFSSKWLYPLFFTLTALWVNIHIFFFSSLIVLGSFGMEALSCKAWNKLRTLLLTSLAVIVGTLVNPLFIRGALYPFFIFGEYGYKVAENQSPFFFFKYHQSGPIHWYILAVMLVVLAGVVFSIFKNWRRNLSLTLLSLFFILSTVILIRFSNFLGIILILTLAEPISHIFKSKFFQDKKNFQSTLLLSGSSFISFIVLAVLVATGLFSPFRGFFGLGLTPQVEKSAKAFTLMELHGPIFNNFDIGSYLIYYLYPKGERVFVDNRAEAYSAQFLNDYKIAQSDRNAWQKLEAQYHFNVIYFYRHDLTSWSQEFLVQTFQDKSWVPVYADDYVVIFVKDVPQNADVIKEYRLPDSLFSITAPTQ